MPEFRVGWGVNVFAKTPESAAKAALAAQARAGTLHSALTVMERAAAGHPWFGPPVLIDLGPDGFGGPLCWPVLARDHPGIDWRVVKQVIAGATSACGGCGSCILGAPQGEPPDYFRHGSVG